MSLTGQYHLEGCNKKSDPEISVSSGNENGIIYIPAVNDFC